MKRFILMMAVAVAFTMTGCGDGSSSQSNNSVQPPPVEVVEDTTPLSLESIGSVDFDADMDGGVARVSLILAYDERIDANSFVMVYAVDGRNVEISPLVAMQRGTSTYSIEYDQYIKPNESDTKRVHTFTLTYIENGMQQLYTSSYKQEIAVDEPPAEDG